MPTLLATPAIAIEPLSRICFHAIAVNAEERGALNQCL
jgi:hypothetical protein